MRRRVWVGLLVVAAVLIVGGVGFAMQPAERAPTGAPRVGHEAPSFALTDAGGRTVALSDYRGRAVVVYFFATYCLPCRSEMPLLQQTARKQSGRLAILAVDKGEPAADVRSFAQEFHVSFPTLVDPNQSLWRQYHVEWPPQSFWIDRSGVIRAIHYGPMDKGELAAALQQIQVG
jgi:peroxiredoxin